MEEARIIQCKCDTCGMEKELPVLYKGKVWGTRKFICQEIMNKENLTELESVKTCDLKVIGEIKNVR